MATSPFILHLDAKMHGVLISTRGSQRWICHNCQSWYYSFLRTQFPSLLKEFSGSSQISIKCNVCVCTCVLTCLIMKKDKSLTFEVFWLAPPSPHASPFLLACTVCVFNENVHFQRESERLITALNYSSRTAKSALLSYSNKVGCIAHDLQCKRRWEMGSFDQDPNRWIG